MPIRREPLAVGQYYHIYNRAIDKVEVFQKPNFQNHFIENMKIYQLSRDALTAHQILNSNQNNFAPAISMSHNQTDFRVHLLAYSLMPNHFHLLLRQTEKEGISTFMQDLQNSFVRFYNLKHQRKGPLFEGRFKAIRITSDSQFLEIIRYIILNPIRAQQITFSQLKSSQLTSLGSICNRDIEPICETSWLNDNFNSKANLLEFLLSSMKSSS